MAVTKAGNILAIHNGTGCVVWRVNPMLRFMHDLGWDMKSFRGRGKFSRDEIEKDLMWADIVLLQSVFDNKIVDYCKANGKTLIFEYDDLLDEVPETHPSYAAVSEPTWKEQVYYAIKHADACITTNELLKARYRHLNENIHVFKNYMDMGYWEKPYNPNTYKKVVRLGWCGGISHQLDLEYVAPVIQRVLQKYDNVKFVCVGDGGASAVNKILSFNYGADHFAELPITRREYSLGTPIDVWADKLNSLQLDIGIAPLVDNTFSRHKTPIKWMEYGINRVPSVCTEFMYGQVINDGVDGFTAKDQDEFYDKVCLLVEDAELRQGMGQRAYEKIKRDHNMVDHVAAWANIVTKTYGKTTRG